MTVLVELSLLFVVAVGVNALAGAEKFKERLEHIEPFTIQVVLNSASFWLVVFTLPVTIMVFRIGVIPLWFGTVLGLTLVALLVAARICKL